MFHPEARNTEDVEDDEFEVTLVPRIMGELKARIQLLPGTVTFGRSQEFGITDQVLMIILFSNF